MQQNLIFSKSSQQFTIMIIAGQIAISMIAFAITKAVNATTVLE